MGNLLGFKKKIRTKQEIDNEYAQHAFYAGTKGLAIQELKKEIEKHHAKMVSLKTEKCQPVEAPKAQEKAGPSV